MLQFRLVILLGLVVAVAGALLTACLLWGDTAASARSCGRATIFYVDPVRGHDRACGDSPAHAWRTVGRVNRAQLHRGSTVLFAGSEPVRWGTASRRRFGYLWVKSGVTYASYGSGEAILRAHLHGPPPANQSAIFLCGVHDVTITNLDLEGGPERRETGMGIISGESLSHCRPSSHIEISHVLIRSWFEGIQAGYHDSYWRIDNVQIDHTSGNGILFDRLDGHPNRGGHDLDVFNSLIEHTGEFPPDYGVHGIYDNSADSQIVGNVIRYFRNDGVSLRFHSATVRGNTIEDGEIGIAHFSYDSVGGTTWLVDNHILRTSVVGIFVCGPREGCRLSPERFVIYGNVLPRGRGGGMNLQPTAAGYEESRPRSQSG